MAWSASGSPLPPVVEDSASEGGSPSSKLSTTPRHSSLRPNVRRADIVRTASSDTGNRTPRRWSADQKGTNDDRLQGGEPCQAFPAGASCGLKLHIGC